MAFSVLFFFFLALTLASLPYTPTCRAYHIIAVFCKIRPISQKAAIAA